MTLFIFLKPVFKPVESSPTCTSYDPLFKYGVLDLYKHETKEYEPVHYKDLNHSGTLKIIQSLKMKCYAGQCNRKPTYQTYQAPPDYCKTLLTSSSLARKQFPSKRSHIFALTLGADRAP